MPLPRHVLDKVNTSGKTCSHTSVLVNIYKRDRFHNYAQQGPPSYTKEWAQGCRKPRNLIETLNPSLKGMVVISEGERMKCYLGRKVDEGPGRRPFRGGRPHKGNVCEDSIEIAGANVLPQYDEAV
ncbi:hypothetical protein CCONF_08090 [Corynebacterium confusum]|nr:hypothetical protein CCONF_08090 [Corynebacterium confusum]